MKNNFDADVVDEVICDSVSPFFADCSSCECCTNCCSEESTDLDDPFCNFDLDFWQLVGLDCGVWWSFCSATSYDPLPVD